MNWLDILIYFRVSNTFLKIANIELHQSDHLQSELIWLLCINCRGSARTITQTNVSNYIKHTMKTEASLDRL